MKSAFVFPGQGSQYIGMGYNFVKHFSKAKFVFEEVDDVLNRNLSEIIFTGRIEELTLTKNAQPALMATSIAILQVLLSETGKSLSELCSYVAGHSLGEFTALCAAGAISLRDTARLLEIRGASMQEAVPENVGTMAAIIGMDFAHLQEFCVKASGLCQIANDNCPGQIVISGQKEAVKEVVETVIAQGKRAIFLAVSAPFHCDMMSPVSKIMQDALNSVNISAPIVPIISNVTAKPESSPIEIKKNLVNQVTKMVRWNESMQFLANERINNIIEIGAGNVLSGMIKRIDRNLTSFSVTNIEDVVKFTDYFSLPTKLADATN